LLLKSLLRSWRKRPGGFGVFEDRARAKLEQLSRAKEEFEADEVRRQNYIEVLNWLLGKV
jgi:hypothetical protein